jgi:CheY-like chemotaxis protein
VPSETTAMPLRVLIGDDAPDILALLDEACRAKGFVTTLASEGATGIAPLRESVRYDIVISNIQMPGADECPVLAAAFLIKPVSLASIGRVRDRLSRPSSTGGL